MYDCTFLKDQLLFVLFRRQDYIYCAIEGSSKLVIALGGGGRMVQKIQCLLERM